MIAALAGGVGAAKFLAGLTQATEEKVVVIGNTADDFRLWGLYISPDLDTVTYTLAGMVGEAGWGIAGDTTKALDQMARLGFDTWFSLRDQDIGTHLARTHWLAEGMQLHEITERIAQHLGVTTPILPMTNDPVRTMVRTADGQRKDFQEYFVKDGFRDEVTAVDYYGAEVSHPGPGVLEALRDARMVIVCPSNPVLSIGPILAVPGIRAALESRRADTVAVTPIIAGQALKGPAAKLLHLQGVEPTALGVAQIYRELSATFVLDERDGNLAAEVQRMDLRPLVTDTVMVDRQAARRLAAKILEP